MKMAMNILQNLNVLSDYELTFKTQKVPGADIGKRGEYSKHAHTNQILMKPEGGRWDFNSFL